MDKFGKEAQKWDGKRSDCKACVNKKKKQRREVALEKRKKEREMAPSGFSVCLFEWCTEGLQPLDQFIGAHVRNNELTMHCLTCRIKQKEVNEQRQAACKKVWDDWRKTHPCVKCMNDPNYEHNPLLIEADHLPEFEKVEKCSDHAYWSHSRRGPDA